MTTSFSPIVVKFIEHAKTAKKPLLDIGSAFGIATHPSLQVGSTVIACVIFRKHLEILASTTPKDTLNRLILHNLSFPLETNYSNNSLSGILISLVLHFLDGETIELGLKKCFQ